MFTFYIENHEPFGSLTKNLPIAGQKDTLTLPDLGGWG